MKPMFIFGLPVAFVSKPSSATEGKGVIIGTGEKMSVLEALGAKLPPAECDKCEELQSKVAQLEREIHNLQSMRAGFAFFLGNETKWPRLKLNAKNRVAVKH